MPIVWQLKLFRDERKNIQQRLEVRQDVLTWLSQQTVPKKYYIFGQDIINNQVWLTFKEVKYESLFALSFLGKPGYRLVTFDHPYQNWPKLTDSKIETRSF
jgi:hypothetical protein